MADREQYLQTQQLLMVVGGLLEDVDIDAFLDANRAAGITGAFFVAPMAYQVATRRLEAMSALARAVQGVQDAHRKLREEIDRSSELAKRVRPLVPGEVFDG